jgi:hypothetical protein
VIIKQLLMCGQLIQPLNYTLIESAIKQRVRG